MPNNLAVSGANPGKQTKAAPIYTGRFFSGINTNRSPLRDARGTRYEEKFIGPAGDALIDGSNLEVTNKLTLGRRPGNPIYDTVNEWQNILSFDEFRVSKALNDVFGETTEEIFTMVSEGLTPAYSYESGNASLSAISGPDGGWPLPNSGPYQKQVGDPSSAPAVWRSASGSAAQAYGVQVGNEWYFGNGVDNKKWLQSLFVRNSDNNSANLPVNTYPFMSTFYVDPNGNIQQLIGAITQSTNQNPPASPNVANVNITNVKIADNTLTLTVNNAPYNSPSNPPIPIGTQYMIWSADNGPTGQFGADPVTAFVGDLAFLQGMTITIISNWVGTTNATVTAQVIYENLDIAVTNSSDAVLQIEQGGAASVNNTVLLGPTTPSWSTQVPDVADNFGGGITIDGQAIWVNRGETVENWGIGAPTESLATPGDITTFGAAAGNWAAGTYYSPASITQDSAGNLWLLTQPGINPPVNFPATPTPATKYDVYSVTFKGAGVVWFGVETAAGTGLGMGDTFQVNRLRVTSPANNTALNTEPLTLGTSLVFTVTDVLTGQTESTYGATVLVKATCSAISTISATSITGDAGYIWTLPNNASAFPLAPHPVTVYPTTAPPSGHAQWTCIQSASSLTWKANTHYYEDDFVVFNGFYQMLNKGVQPFIHSLPPGTTDPSGLHPTYNTHSGQPTGPWPAALTPVTSYLFSNNNTGYPFGANPSFGDAVGSWPYFGYTSPITPDSVFAPAPNSLWFQTTAAQTQPTGPNKILAGQTGDLFFYYMGGNAYLNIEGSPGVLMLGGAEDSGQGSSAQYGVATVANIYVPQTGIQFTFNLDHNSGGFFGILGSGITGPNYNLIGGITSGSVAYGIPTANLIGANVRVQGPNPAGGANPAGEDHVYSDAGTVSFGATGLYILEVDWTPPQNSDAAMFITIGGTFVIAPTNTVYNLSVGQDLSWTSSNFGPFTTKATATPPPAWAVAPFPNAISWGGYTREQSGIYYWQNIGPVSNYVNTAGVSYTISGTGIVYNNSEFLPYTAGISGPTVPNTSFASATTAGQVVQDNGGTLYWMYIGAASSSSVSTAGTITAAGPQGFIYGIALVNTLDNTVSNLGPTNEINGVGIEVIGGLIVFAPGAGLDTLDIDPQADYVAIFRTTANGSIELLVPSNGNTIYTVPLVQYLQYGYVDSTQDADLDILIQGAAAQQNTPPLPGAINLTYFANRLWYSIGNTVWYTTGPSDPSGNGVNGTAPGNNQAMLSRVTRLVPSSIGMLVFTLSDVIVIPVNNGAILTAQPYIPGVGLSSYNALDVRGTLIGFFTTDHQFLEFTPAVGADNKGNPIANLFRMNIGEAGLNWDPANTYVTWYVSGEDQGWFVADGTFGWFRLVDTPAPEKGEAWSPFATINPVTNYGYAGQGCGAIKSVEVEPGDHRLLIGPSTNGGTDGFGSILYRNLDASTDGGSGTYNGGPLTNGTTYPVFGVFGSYVVAHPGQVAMISFITTDQVNVGSPAVLGVIFDEALPYYTGSFDIIKNWVTDPPNLPESSSILGQRFYMSEAGDGDTSAMARHMQILIQWPAESALNELQSFTIFGSFAQQG
jgi:hypothetical protein